MGVQVGGLDVVTLLGAIAGGRGGWVYTLADWTWLPLLAAIAGCHCWGWGGGCTRWRIGRGAVAGCHCRENTERKHREHRQKTHRQKTTQRKHTEKTHRHTHTHTEKHTILPQY